MRAAELSIEAISDPMAAQEAARKMALRSDLAQGEVELLRGILQPWWDTERDAILLYSHLAALGSVEGQGSPAHRRVVHIAILCALTVLPNVREQDRAEATKILDTLAAWARGEAPETNLKAIRDETSTLYVDAAIEATLLEGDGEVRQEILISADISGSAASAVDEAARATDALLAIGKRPPCSPHLVAIVAGHAHAFDRSQGRGWEEARDRRLSELADLIRSEIPVCPMA